MRKPRRLVVALAVSGLIAASAVAASQLAHADVAGTCTGLSGYATCSVTETISQPTSLSVSMLAYPRQKAAFQWTLECSLGGASTTTSGSDVVLSPPTITIPIDLPYTNPDSCNINVTGDDLKAELGNKLTITVNFTTGTSSTGSSSVVRGYGGKCLDDKGNSSANGAKVIIWSCNSSDSAQGFSFSSGELKHNGKCVNDQGNGGSGTKVILWACNGGSNEKWFHSSNGEFVLSLSSHGLLCLNDPGNSTTNGTQLIVYTCKNTSNEHWSV